MPTPSDTPSPLPSPEREPSEGYYSRPTDTHNIEATRDTPEPGPSEFEFEDVDPEAASDGGTSQFSRPTIPSEGPVGPRKRSAKKASGPARVRLGQYEIVREIGRGGMGIVYEGYQPKLDRRVALKVLPEHLSSNKGLVARFLVEARAVARFHHPNIAAIYEIGEDDGTNYFAMEFIEGRTLSDLIIKRDLDDAEIIVKVVADAARALDYAHRAGVIHRDIKPSNIMLTDEGTVKIMDFGLARVEGDERLTVTGMTLGTPAYMSPEQAGSKLAGPIDHRSDIYSLGVVLYEMLTLRIPFDGRSKVEILRNIIDEKVPPPSKFRPDLQPEIERIILKALAKRAEERYTAAGELANDLEKFLHASKPHPADATVWRRPLSAKVLTISAIVLIALGVGMGLWIRELSRPGVSIVAVEQPASSTRPAVPPGNDVLEEIKALREKGERWRAGMLGIERHAALKKSPRPDDVRQSGALGAQVEAIRLELIESARLHAAEGRFVEAVAAMLGELELDAAWRGEARLPAPPIVGLAEPAPDSTPSQRVEAILIAGLGHVMPSSVVLWAWGERLANADKGYAATWPVAALAERAAAAQPELACVLEYALAEEAPTPAARAIHVQRLFESAAARTLDWAGLSLLVAAHRPTFLPLQRQLAFSEHRWRVREVLRRMDLAGGWRKASAAALAAQYAEFAVAFESAYREDVVAAEKGAFLGDFAAPQPRPKASPRGRYEAGTDREVPMRAGLAASSQGVKARFFALTRVPLPTESPLAGLTDYTIAGTADIALGDGAEQVKHAFVLLDEDAERWIVLVDEDGDGSFADEGTLSRLYPLIPDFRLESRFATVMPLALKIGVLNRESELGLAVETIGCRTGQIVYDGRHVVMLRLWDLDSDGIFDDFEEPASGGNGGGSGIEPGARLDWELVATGAAPPDPRQYQTTLDVQWLGTDRRSGSTLLYSVRAAGSLRDHAALGDCIELPGGTVLRLAEVAPGGGIVYVDWDNSAAVAGRVSAAPSNAPAAGARVVFSYRNFTRELIADENGQIGGLVPHGRCIIRAEAPGFEPYVSSAVTLTERNATTLSIALVARGAAASPTPAP